MMEKVVEERPEWLDNDFLSKVLQSYKHDNTIKVSSFTTNAAFSEHFASTMFQSLIEFSSSRFPKSELETISVVIKAKPVSEGIKMQVVGDGPLFETEIKMYNEVLPAMKKLFERSGMKVDLAPELIYAATEPFAVIILKDMSPEGFSAPRTSPKELEDSKMIMKRLAEFHAASYYLAENNELDLSSFNYTIYSRPDIIKGFFDDNLRVFLEVLGTWEGFEKFIPKVEYLRENISEIACRSYVANKPGVGYNILNHGDFHTRNLLFKMNENKRLEKFFFIDYQISVYCSPAVDFSYVMGIVTRDEDGEIPTEELTMFYHEEFVKALKTIGFLKPVPSLLDLNIELLKHGAINMLLMICFIPFAFIDWETMKVEDMMANDKADDLRKMLFNLPVCTKLLQRELKSWVHKGWF